MSLGLFTPLLGLFVALRILGSTIDAVAALNLPDLIVALAYAGLLVTGFWGPGALLSRAGDELAMRAVAAAAPESGDAASDGRRKWGERLWRSAHYVGFPTAGIGLSSAAGLPWWCGILLSPVLLLRRFDARAKQLQRCETARRAGARRREAGAQS